MDEEFIAYIVDLIPNRIIHKTWENDISAHFTAIKWKTEGNTGMVLVNETKGSFIPLSCFSRLPVR